MEKQKENVFLEKFRLLNSQEHTEDINWSSSCSSDYEDALLNDKSFQDYKMRNRKRKRKKKVAKNISNLSITITNTINESKKLILEEKSPILCCKSRRKSASKSPIFKPSQSVYPASSPILASKTICLKSPILTLKAKSPKSAVKVRKKLFNIENINKNQITNENQRKSLQQEEFSNVLTITKESDAVKSNHLISKISKSEEMDENNSMHGNRENISREKSDLVMRVKSFFDSHFSSENTSIASQNSISDILTPKNCTKTSDEIEIFTCKTQVLSNNNSVQSLPENSVSSSESSLYNFNKNSKMIRYKKDGLAFRLNNLLKKQNASLSLWQHERFLAANSNFVIPKGEFIMFRIQKVTFKYGCHLLVAVGVNDDKFLILINTCYVSDNIVNETVLKLYKPYNIVQYDDCKLIINVTKFECSKYKSTY